MTDRVEPRGPALARWLVRISLESRLAEEVVGDLEEEFSRRIATVSPDTFGRSRRSNFRRVRGWYWRMALGSISAGFVPAGRWRALAEIGESVRSAVRTLRHRPMLVLSATVVIALGVGAGVTVFTLGNAVFLRDIPGTVGSDRLHSMVFRHPDGFSTRISVPTLRELTEDIPGLRAVSGYNPTGVAVSVEGRPPVSISAVGVEGDYFGRLGVRPRLGRMFGPEEWDPARPRPVVVLSERLWVELFQSDPNVIGRTITVANRSYTVLGVTDRFRGVLRGGRTDLWFNVGDYFQMGYDSESSVMDRSRPVLFQALVEVEAGAEPDAVQLQLRGRFASIVDANPDGRDGLEGFSPLLEPLTGLSSFTRDRAATVLRMLGLGGLLLLLISCANVANLLLLSAARRMREGAIRGALGATRSRLVWERFCESLMLAIPGGALGVGLSILVVPWVASTTLGSIAGGAALSLDGRVLGFSVAMVFGTALLFGFAPAFVFSGDGSAARMRASSAGTTRSGSRFRFGLSAAQIGVSFALLVGAILLGRSVGNLTRVPLGFESENVWSFSFDPGRVNRSVEESARLARRVVADLEARGDVHSVALASFFPFGGARSMLPLASTDPDAEPSNAIAQFVSEDYFEVLRLPVLHGRGFLREEFDPPPGTVGSVAVLSATLAERLFGAQDPVGRTVEQRMTAGPIPRTVVGVVADARFDEDLTGAVDLTLYLPLSESSWTNHVGLVRTAAPVPDLGDSLRETMARLDRSVPVSSVEPLDARVARATARQRSLALLLFFFSGAAILLSGVGLYTVIAYGVRQRVREWAIRMALGANSKRLVRQVLGSGLRVGTVGLLLGVGVAVLSGRTIQSQLFGITLSDPLTYALAGAGFLVVVLVASAVPARRSARIDPIRQLGDV